MPAASPPADRRGPGGRGRPVPRNTMIIESRTRAERSRVQPITHRCEDRSAAVRPRGGQQMLEVDPRSPGPNRHHPPRPERPRPERPRPERPRPERPRPEWSVAGVRSGDGAGSPRRSMCHGPPDPSHLKTGTADGHLASRERCGTTRLEASGGPRISVASTRPRHAPEPRRDSTIKVFRGTVWTASREGGQAEAWRRAWRNRSTTASTDPTSVQVRAAPNEAFQKPAGRFGGGSGGPT